MLTITATACSDDVEPAQNNAKNNTNIPDMRVSPDADQAPDQGKPTPDMPSTEDMDRPDLPVKPLDMPPDWDFGPPPDMEPDAFKVISIIPPQGSLTGNTLVRIKGQGLTEGTTIYLGSKQLPVEIVADNLVGYTPQGTAPGPVTLKAIAPDGRTSVLTDAFTYTTTLRFDSVTPSRVPTQGGVEVEILGEGFTEQMAVSFSGTQALRVEVLSATQLRAITPPRARGLADLRLTTPSDSIVAKDALEYFEPLAIARIEPASGPTTGNTQAIIYGAGFGSQAQVRLNNKPAQITDINQAQNTITILTPANPAGLADLTIQQGPQSALLQDAYLYRATDSPTLATVRPSFGPEDGGQEVWLTGVGLDDPQARFVFGGQDATILSQSATIAKVRTPANTPGPVDVIFYSAQTERARLSQAYTYKRGLWLDQLNPAQGPAQGGTTVTLTGRGLNQVERVSFGGLLAQFTITSDTELQAITPAHAAGPVDVTIERDGLKATLLNAFTYTEPLEIWGFNPTRGAIAGGTFIHVRGRGFYGDLSVTLGNNPGATLRRLDRNNLTFYSPPGPRGEAQLIVKAGQALANGPYPFEYFNPANRFGGASGTVINGAVNVSVYDQGGSPIPNAFVMLSTRPDTRYQGFTNEAGMITLSGPEVLGAQSVTATAAGYSAGTVQAVDAENITIFLNQLDPRPGQGSGEPPPFATISGRVTTLGKLSDPADARAYDLTIVRTTSVYPTGGNPNPGAGSTIIGGTGDYEITTRVGDLAVVALCGVYNQDTETFDAQFMGVRRFLFVSNQDHIKNTNVACDIPLDQDIPVKLVNTAYAPTGPDNNAIIATWNFGFEGYYQSPTIARSLSDLITLPKQPASTGAIADLSIDLQGGSYTDLYPPSTQTIVPGVRAQQGLITMPALLDVPEPVSPLPGGVIVNNELRWQASGPYLPSIYIISLRNERGIPVWSMVAPGDATSVRLPTFPDFSALPIEQRPDPYQQGPLYLSLTAARIANFSFDQFTYEDLNATRWEASAVTRWQVQFAP